MLLLLLGWTLGRLGSFLALRLGLMSLMKRRGGRERLLEILALQWV